MQARRPRIAINAQFSPYQAGGVESNLLSLLANGAWAGAPVELALLTAPQFTPQFRHVVGQGAQVLPWRLGNEVVVSGWPETARQRALKARLPGVARLLVDAAATGYRLARYGRPPQKSPAMRRSDRVLARHDVRAVHFPSGHIFKTSLPFIYEPWDLLFRHYPETLAPEECEFRERTYRHGCENARIVVTAARWIKDDVVRQFNVPPERVLVIRRGSSYASAPVSDAEAELLLRAYGITRPFMLYPAMSFEHKNHLGLFQALARLRANGGLPLELVLTGRRYEPYWPRLEAALDELRLRQDVRILGVVRERILAALYRKARFVVFPSLFEGLGLPLLEALNHRTPVLASRATCIPEVLGAAARYFDARDPASIAAAIARAMAQPAWMEEPLQHAQAQLGMFSWARARQTFLAAYQSVLGLPLDEESRAQLAQAAA